MPDEDGLEELEIGGERSKISRRGFPSTLGAMGDPDLRAMQLDPERTYLGEAPYGSMDPDERIELLDAEGIDAVVLYTTIGLLWEAELDDRRAEPGVHARLQPLDLRVLRGQPAADPDRAPVAERSRRGGRASWSARSAKAHAARTSRRSPTTAGRSAIPTTIPVFAAAQDLDVPFAIHPTFEPQWTKGTRMGSWENVKQLRLLASVTASDGVRQQFTTLFDYGVFDRFPRLKVVVLESGGGWIGYWLDRIDAVYGHTFIGTARAARAQAERLLPRPGVDLVRSRRADDPGARRAVRRDRFMWASDFPHADHTPEYIDRSRRARRRASRRRAARQFLGDNARRLFRIEA